jgi:uncharacterized RDD family membrane protein YckC
MAKCPKCQYFSFDSGDRCRNCGYDFSLSLDLPADDLEIQNGTEPIGPLGDFTLQDTPNLPLFRPGDPDAALVTPNATPRAPLAVRRGAPTTGRPARPKPDPAPRLALDTAEIPIVAPPVRAPSPAIETPPADVERVDGLQTAGTIARLGAAAIDLALLGGIDLMVLYFTLKVCDLTFGDVLLLPAVPLLLFLLLLDGGYLSTFVAAGGQTIGKMATGIRVVSADPAASRSERVTFGHAIVRAAAYLISLAPAGLGFLPVFFGRERRGLHDRLADTRVIRA